MKRTSDYLNEIAREGNVFYELSEEERASLKECLLSIYKDIAKVCEKYNLTVMLGGGSALGAVRHHGFIPWDDDMDLMMPRKDYDKFIQVFDQELSEKYLLSVPRYHRNVSVLFMKVERKNTVMKYPFSEESCVSIDIFPIESMPNNSLLRRIKCNILDMMRLLFCSIEFYRYGIKFKKAISKNWETEFLFYMRYLLGFILMIFGKKRLYNLFDSFASSSSGTLFYSVPTGRKFSRGECLESNVFFPCKKTLFEGIEMLIPNKYDIYLSNLYGDYMKIPSESERERHFYTEFCLNPK